MDKICSPVNCTGCEACANVCPQNCITFVPDREGFFVPALDSDKCVDCKLCLMVCPANSEPEYKSKQDNVYAAWSLDNKIRQSSSSGGLYSVFADYCFSQGGVVNGVLFNDELFAVHRLFDSPEQIIPCRGSKYVQSRPNDIYKQIKNALNRGRMVFFTSNPCQVNALYKYLGKDYENLYTCDFVCHGVPSPQYFKHCLNRITDDKKDISQITFRDLSSWGKYEINATDSEQRFSESKIIYSYTKIFLAGAAHRYSCYNCAFARSERIGDITLGDFWGVGKYRPFLHDTSKGVSLLIVNSPKGEALLEKVKDKLFLQKRSFREAARDNYQLRQSVRQPANRNGFYTDIHELSDRDLIKKYVPGEPLWKKIILLPLRVVRKILHIGIIICCKLRILY